MNGRMKGTPEYFMSR